MVTRQVPIRGAAAMLRAFMRFISLSLVAALAACGGGGGGGDSPPASPAFADTAAAWWASSTGARWSYQIVDQRSGSTPMLATVTDMGDTVVNGHTVRRFEHSRSMFSGSSETEYRYYEGGAIRTSAVDGPEGWNGPLDYAELPAPLREGVAQTVFDATQAVDLDGDGKPDTLRVEVSVTLARVATLSVPAGDFRNLVSARQLVKATATQAGTNLTTSATAVLTTWYAPGVGVVRRLYEDPGFNGQTNTVSEELVGVALGSLHAGVLPLPPVLDGIGYGGSSATPPGLGLAIAGDRFMTVAAAESGTVEGSIVDAGGARLWRGTLLAPPAGQRFDAAGVAFDGTDFRIVGLRGQPNTSPGSFALIGQRVTLAGVLRDGPQGVPLDSGIADASQTLASLRLATRNGQLLVVWGRYDTTLVPWRAGLLAPRGYVVEGRLFGAGHAPLAARFELGNGLPEALALRGEQYVVLRQWSALGSTLGPPELVAWAVSAAGVPVSTTPQVISRVFESKSALRLHAAGSDLWLTWAESVIGVPGNVVKVARLGADAVLLDGTPEAPGRTLLPAGDARAGALVFIGATRSALEWVEGWSTLKASTFDTALVGGGGALPSALQPLVAEGPYAGFPGPQRVPAFVAEFQGGLAFGWLDNEQSGSTPTDRLQMTLVQPRIAP